MGDKAREKFINKNIHTVVSFEKLEDTSLFEDLECKQIHDIYKASCDKVNILINVKDFYIEDWYNVQLNTIYNIDNYKDLKTQMIKLKMFKKILKIHNDIDSKILEEYIHKCISGRIKYKYQCVSKKDRNRKHDAEILRQIFYRDRYYELKKLLNNMNTRYLEIKKEKLEQRYQEDQDEMEFLELVNTSDSFEPVVTKIKQR